MAQKPYCTYLEKSRDVTIRFYDSTDTHGSEYEDLRKFGRAVGQDFMPAYAQLSYYHSNRLEPDESFHIEKLPYTRVALKVVGFHVWAWPYGEYDELCDSNTLENKLHYIGETSRNILGLRDACEAFPDNEILKTYPVTSKSYMYNQSYREIMYVPIMQAREEEARTEFLFDFSSKGRPRLARTSIEKKDKYPDIRNRNTGRGSFNSALYRTFLDHDKNINNPTTQDDPDYLTVDNFISGNTFTRSGNTPQKFVEKLKIKIKF